jgi:hypothetical protein
METNSDRIIIITPKVYQQNVAKLQALEKQLKILQKQERIERLNNSKDLRAYLYANTSLDITSYNIVKQISLASAIVYSQSKRFNYSEFLRNFDSNLRESKFAYLLHPSKPSEVAHNFVGL